MGSKKNIVETVQSSSDGTHLLIGAFNSIGIKSVENSG